MPVVPGYRARSTTEISSIPLDPGMNFRDNTHATGDMFGAQVGEALSSVGRGVADVGKAVTAVRAIDDANYAKEADTGFSQDVRDLGYGENGYFGKQGAAAVEGLKGFEDSLRQSAQKRAAALPPGAQRGFMDSANLRIQSTLQSAYGYAMDQRKNWSIQTGNARLDGFQNDALTNYTNPAAINAAIAEGQKEIRSNPAYSPDVAAMKEREYVSTVRYNTGLRLLTDDPKKAEAYFNENKSQFSGEDQYKFTEALKTPLLNANVRANTASFFKGGVGSQAAPADAAALIRSTEGFRTQPYWDVNAYRIGYGSDTITRADGSIVKVAPGMTVTRDDAERDLTRRINTEFVPGIVKVVGEDAWSKLPPSSQAALASVAYNYGSLPFRVENAVVMGNPEEIARQVEALQDDNGGVNKGRRLQEAAIIRGTAGVSVPQMKEGGTAPDVEAFVSGITNPDEAAATRKAIYDQIGVQQTAMKALSKAEEDRLENRIALEDPTLSVDEIQNNPRLDDGQRAKLTNSLTAKSKDIRELRQNIDAFAAGNLVVDGYSEAGRKTNDAVWSSISAIAPPEERQVLLDALVKQTGVVPTDVINRVRFNLSSGNPQQAQAALDMGSHLRSVDPAALARSPSGGALADQVALYDHYTSSVGLAPAEATRRILDAQDPEKVRQRAALMNTDPMKKAIDAAATESNVRSLFGGGWLSSSPTLGKNAAQSAAIVSDYRDTLVESVFDAGGDVDAGTKLANDRFQRRYGTSSLSMDGPSSVMFLPPEKTYPSDPKGSHDYIREQALAAVSLAEKAKGVPDRMVVGNPAGLVEKGNIDLLARPQVKNEDGSISTVRSMSFDEDGKEVLIPTVSPDGKILSNQDAIDLYRRTGQHLGKFSSVDAADAYAEALHNQQADFYSSSSQVKNVFLVLDKITEADVRAGRAPRYQAWYTDSKGKYQFAPARFFATPPAGSGKPATDPSLIPSLEAIRQDSLKWNADMSPADMAPDQMITGPMPKIELSAPSPDQSLSQDISPADMAPGPLTVPAEKPAKARK